MDLLKALKLTDINPSTYSAAGWTDTTDATTLDSINPATEALIAQIYTCSQDDYETVISASEAAQKEWSKVPAPKRGEVIRQIGNALREHKDALGALIALEMGKIKAEGDGEVQEMIDIADFAVGQSRMMYGNTMHSERPEHRMYEQWHPLGVIGVISAFNFPVAVWAWNAFIAAVAGNTVVWKPSSKTPLCAIAVQKICNEVLESLGHPGIFSLFIPSDKNTVQRFINDKRAALISFTGSSQVGHTVAKSVAKRFGRSLLECSGNNAVIVDETADLDLAIPAIVFGAVGTAGQRCTSTRRVIVHNSIHDELVKRLVNAYKQIRIGNPLDANVLMGPLISKGAMNDYQEAIAQIKAKGGRIMHGGRLIKGPGYFVEPTIACVNKQYVIVKNETFVPILYVIPYRNIEGAIYLQNDVPQGLSSAIFTNSIKHAELFLSSRGSDCGIANVNIGTSGAEIGGAFGGEKETGGGREAGSDCWKSYMRRQTNTINWSDELPLAQGIKFEV